MEGKAGQLFMETLVQSGLLADEGPLFPVITLPHAVTARMI